MQVTWEWEIAKWKQEIYWFNKNEFRFKKQENNKLIESKIDSRRMSVDVNAFCWFFWAYKGYSEIYMMMK